MVRFQEVLRVRPSLQPVAWVLLCTQVPNLAILAWHFSLFHAAPEIAVHLLRGLVFGLAVGALWFFKERCPIGRITKGPGWLALGLILGLGWAVGTVWLGGGAKGIRGIPHGTTQGWAASVLLVLSIGICFPFFEELLFRGILVQQLRALNSNRVFLIFGSAGLFLMVHLGYGMGWLDVIQVFVAGVVLACLAIRSESLWPSILLHSSYNIWLVAVVSVHHH